MATVKFRIDEVLGIDPGPLTDLNDPLEERYYGAFVRGVVGDTGETVEDFTYGITPDDRGTNADTVRAAVQAWLDAGNEFPAYTPPTAEEVRETMPNLTARQFRLGLINAGVSLSQINTNLAAIEDETERESAMVEWEYATEFSRTHPLVVSLSADLGFSPEEVDTIWVESLEL